MPQGKRWSLADDDETTTMTTMTMMTMMTMMTTTMRR
jgi:hypothetical protein